MIPLSVLPGSSLAISVHPVTGDGRQRSTLGGHEAGRVERGEAWAGGRDATELGVRTVAKLLLGHGDGTVLVLGPRILADRRVQLRNRGDKGQGDEAKMGQRERGRREGVKKKIWPVLGDGQVRRAGGTRVREEGGEGRRREERRGEEESEADKIDGLTG